MADAVMSSGGSLQLLVHNAATVEPVCPAMRITEEEWATAFATNVHAPLFLTQTLLPSMTRPARVLHISSGAAHRAIEGWAAYCATKAALHSLFLSLSTELRPEGVLVGSARPGVVDTPMQAVIRAAAPEAMPGVERFRELHAKMPEDLRSASDSPHAPPTDSLDSAANVAEFLRFVLLDTTDDDFVRNPEWDIRDASHHARWLPSP